MDFSNISKKQLYLLGGGMAGVVALLALGFFLFGYNSFVVKGSGEDKVKAVSPLTGVECATATSRPFAVMVSSDREARPLSGISEADWVFEMPVVENGFTRMMAVYQCGLSAGAAPDRPLTVGSVRSARLDFTPLALGLHAIYAHFGGEHDALAQLDAGIIDNIDGLKYDGTYYYRQSGIPRPHNAFTDFDRLTEVSAKLKYDMADAKVSYTHEAKSRSVGELNPPELFNKKFRVVWTYDKTTNAYRRSRSGKPEVDKLTGQIVTVSNVVILKTTWTPINRDYIRVKTVGAGGLLLYKNGTVVTGTWEKPTDQAKLTFYDQNHKEIELAVGKVWVEIDAH